MRPASEPNAAPRKTTGPCRPTEPPEPIVSVAATILPAALVAGSRPPRESSATITSGTEWPRASRRQDVRDRSDEQTADGRDEDQPRVRQAAQPVILEDVEEEVVTEFDEGREADRGEAGAQPDDGGKHHRSGAGRALHAPGEELSELSRCPVRRGRHSQHVHDSSAGLRKRLRHRGEAGRGRRRLRRRRFVATRGARSPRPSREPRTPRPPARAALPITPSSGLSSGSSASMSATGGRRRRSLRPSCACTSISTGCAPGLLPAAARS